MIVGRGLAPAVFLFSTHVAVGEHSICSRKRKDGYGIRPTILWKISLFFGGSKPRLVAALRYELVFSAKVAEASFGSPFFIVLYSDQRENTAANVRDEVNRTYAVHCKNQSETPTL